MTFYMDGVAHFSLATPATLDTDLMFMIDLAAGGGWPIDPALDHVSLYVDYFRFYELNDDSIADRMEGGAGNDVYVVDNAGDIVNESLAGSNGIDTVQSWISFSLANTARVLGAVENLTLLGSGNINGTGNALNNVITGNAGANVLNGGSGADNMRGGAGNDVYVVDNAGDIVNESVSGSNGIDTIQSSISFSLANTRTRARRGRVPDAARHRQHQRHRQCSEQRDHRQCRRQRAEWR